MIITLDGPCGSGKSTLAQLLAQRLGYFYINSGFFYRSLAYLLVEKLNYDNKKLENPEIRDIEFVLDEKKFIYQYKNGFAQVFFQGQEITHHLNRLKIPQVG